jgi:threonine dehydratase
MAIIAGVDGCKAGWLVAITEDWPATKPVLKLCPRFENVVEETASCDVTVIDIPMGLPVGASGRRCDTQARKRLCEHGVPNAHSRVFRAPPRSVLQFLEWPEFQRHITELISVSPTKQAFDFSAKVKEVDDAMDSALQERIIEFHPEPTWKRIAGYTLQSKHTALGLLQRLKGLQELHADWIFDLMNESMLTKVNLDDLLDAIVGLDVATNIRQHSTPSDRAAVLAKVAHLNRYPDGKPEMDEEKQLRMEIWY